MLSLWDAAELDAAGEEGEVLPKFINLTDASIKMVTQPRNALCASSMLADTRADRIIADEVERRTTASEYPKHQHGRAKPLSTTF